MGTFSLECSYSNTACTASFLALCSIGTTGLQRHAVGERQGLQSDSMQLHVINKHLDIKKTFLQGHGKCFGIKYFSIYKT